MCTSSRRNALRRKTAQRPKRRASGHLGEPRGGLLYGIEVEGRGGEGRQVGRRVSRRGGTAPPGLRASNTPSMTSLADAAVAPCASVP